ncbi:MAG: pentapeptide repeat-containing protein [Candidatus Thiodiazotropha sp.]
MKNQDERKPQSWFVRHDGLISGPLSNARIRHLLLAGELELSDQISPDKQSWQAIGRIPGVVPLQMRADAGDSEAQAKLAAREQADARDSQEEKRFPLAALVISLLIVGGLVLYSLWVGMPDAIETPACDTAPAPGVNWRNCLINDLDVGAASLAGANLNSAVLRRARLSATDLSNADLRYVNLSHADLRHAQLQGTALMGAKLQFADLRGADLNGADLRFADLTQSRIDDANLQNARLGSALWLDGRSCAAGSIGKCELDADE